MSNQKKRPEIVAIYKEVSEFIGGKEFAFLLNFGGLTVSQMADLRRQLAAKNADMMVVKNTFIAKIAAEQGVAFPEGVLSGPTAVITGSGDIADTAKTVVDFVKKNEKASVKAGLMDKEVLTAQKVTDLSELISLAAQQARILAALQAPAGQLVRVIQAKVDKENEGAPASAETPSAEGNPDGTPAA